MAVKVVVVVVGESRRLLGEAAVVTPVDGLDRHGGCGGRRRASTGTLRVAISAWLRDRGTSSTTTATTVGSRGRTDDCGVLHLRSRGLVHRQILNITTTEDNEIVQLIVGSDLGGAATLAAFRAEHPHILEAYRVLISVNEV